jgi:hypothetical protein
MGDQGNAPALELDPAIHSVEFKFTVSAADEKLVEAGLHEPRQEPLARKIWFFDSDDLALFDAHVVLRARATEGAGEDSTVKLRPVVPSAVDPMWKEVDGFEIQLDVVGADPQPSAKLDADQDAGELADVVAGRRALDRLFSADQERFLRDLARIGEPLATVAPRGPVDVQRWTLEPDLLTEKVTVERWVMPGRRGLRRALDQGRPRGRPAGRPGLPRLARPRGPRRLGPAGVQDAQGARGLHPPGVTLSARRRPAACDAGGGARSPRATSPSAAAPPR